MTDPRTPYFSYRTVEIGGRTWMAENMAWQEANSFCYDGNTHNCEIYGRLYVWGDAKNLCPEGWSLPSKGEWEELIKSVGDGSAKKAGEALKTNSGWKNDGNGTDKYGFSALPAGFWSNYSGDGGYYGLEGAAHFWSATATESGSNSAYGLKLEYTVDSASMSEYYVTGDHYYALSVRCILDTNYFVDNRDGKTYRMVKIGDQVWMAQNLNYKGEGKDTIGYCYGKNSANCNKYGRLYPIEETIEKGSVCPEGWHLPDTTEWFALFSAVDGKENAATHLNSTSGWKEPGNGDDKFGFSALPGGRGAASGSSCDGEKENAWFLSKTQCQTTSCKGRYFTANFVYSLQSAAFTDFTGTTSVSVRCLKD
ncbi:fibrobacter succinogenes major paralogous domain-containing protein [Fibrobacter sp. UWR3]|uniref:fibrobacter succinogenes major paralogous domain-containing protein n=1 Tax=Fibrobacter sp. UWR3 TaxID=1896217 RepID=UPI000932893D|nr:fibrobacter succinogenes major paralogous domain-containing protein [Fibrobacter sp. UWR3]